MELHIRELHKDDFPLENSPQRQKLLDAIRKATAPFTLSGKGIRPPEIRIWYGRRPASSGLLVTDYDSGKYSDDDDLSISVLRADLGRILRDLFPNSLVDSTPFVLSLAFGDPLPEENRKQIARQDKEEQEEVLNVLPVEPRFSLDQMVLPEEIRGDLEDVLALLRSRKKIYEDWGFASVDPISRTVVNFHGEPGTGKTMAAHALAREFGKKILALNYADIESKYVGDAPKNLMAAFHIARETDAMLFFDEADSFLGKRIRNVSQSADQAVNSLRSQMLMLLEEHPGVVIFATNLLENYDSAFKSRILKHIRFDLPNREQRAKLIRKMLPSATPLKEGEFTDADILDLADRAEGFSGREIKNAILNGLILSARGRDYFALEDAREAFAKVAKSLTSPPRPMDGDATRRLERQIRKKLGWKKGKKQRLSPKSSSYNLIKAGRQ